MELINKLNFAKAALDKNFEKIVVYIVALRVPGATETVGMPIYPDWANQVQVATLQHDKALTKIPPEYNNYANVFSSDLAMELPGNTDINEHAIKLIEGKQPFYSPIYSLVPMELEMLKAYIEIYL